MKPQILRKSIGTLALAALLFTATDSWARLPKPIQIETAIALVDYDTQTVVVKPGKEQKPFVLDWNKDTQFIKNGEAVTATDLKPGVFAVIHYKRVSFRGPFLKKIAWEDKSNAK